MHAGMVVLLAASAVRYFTRHGWGDNAPTIVALSISVLVAYVAGVAAKLTGPRALVWIATVILGWSALALVASSFAWCAFPLFFVCLRDLSGRAGAVALGAITTVSVVAQLRVASPPDASLVVGPITVAVLTAVTYRALLNETKARQTLIDDLLITRQELAEQQRAAGASAERQRLAGEIHDTIAQGLASSLMLLQAAKEEGMVGDTLARRYLDPVLSLSRDNLAEARRFVRALAPAILDGRTLPEALERQCTSTASASGTRVEFELVGQEVPMDAEQETAVLRFVQGALANVAMHAGATRTVVTLSYLPDGVAIDVCDNGIGFVPGGEPRPTVGTGFGLRSIRHRMEALSGLFSIESSLGEGTTLAGWIPYRNTAESRTGAA